MVGTSDERALTMLHFCTGDRPTDHNLQRLSHLASLDRFDADAEQMHQWLSAVIDSVGALPKAAAVHFTGFYFLGNSHFEMSAEHRRETWRTLVQELRSHVAAAHADDHLKQDGPYGPPNLSDRRQTRGERIIALCDKLERNAWGTPEFEAILARLEAIAVGETRSDVSELKRLSGRKRIPDVDEHHYWIVRHIAHIRLVANQLHHLG